MKNKGFTLIELIGSIIILAIIALVAFPAILGLLTSSEGELNKAKVQVVERAAKEYVDDHINEYPRNINAPVKKVSVETLINQGYVRSKTLNEKDTKITNGCIDVSVISTTVEGSSMIRYDFKFNENC